ncbi:MAG: hypothetical protein MI923_03700 [Phycisphaerales bacterium]|nr:hypothetical protein [Phycisphaerales bacterium]
MKIQGFKNIHAGRSAIVLGCGPSSAKLAGFGNCFTVGVNEICDVYHINYLVLQNYDYQVPKDRWKKIVEASPDFIFSPFPIRSISERENFVHVPPGDKCGIGLGKGGRIDYSETSAYMAICLAVYLGASDVGVIGVDFCSGRFSGGNMPHELETAVARMNSEFEALATAMSELGVGLFNLSDISKLSVLPRLAPEDFISRKNADMASSSPEQRTLAYSPGYSLSYRR